MAGFGYKYLAFLITVHTMLYFAGAQGMVAHQAQDNPHKKFVDKFRDDNMTEKAQVSESSGIVESTFSPILAISDLINTIIGILVSPYSAIQATQLPAFLQLLIQSLMGLSEIYTGYLAVRGGL